MILVLKYKKLQKIHFKIAVQSSVFNTLVSVDFNTLVSVEFITAVITSIAYHWLFGEIMCGIIGAGVLSLAMAKLLVLLIFVVDRFLSVFVPYGYPKHQKVVLAFLCLAAWSISLVALVIGFILDCYEFISHTFWCYLNASCSKSCAVFLGVVDVVILIPANIIPVVLYVMLFIKAKKLKKAAAIEDKFDWNATVTFFLVFLTTFLMAIPNVVTELVAQTIFPHDEALPAPLFVWLVAT